MRWVLLCLIATSISYADEIIYGMMITGQKPIREQFAKVAMENFKNQTHKEKRLIIINHGNYTLKKPGMWWVEEYKVENGLTIGALRNRALEHIPNEAVWVQWDDDDYRSTNYLASKYARMKSKKADAVFATCRLNYVFNRNAAALGFRKSGYQGIVMARKKAGFRFPNVRKGEDKALKHYYHKHHKITKWNNPPSYYIRTAHGDNLIFRGSRKTMQNNEWKLSRGTAKYLARVLRQYKFALRSDYKIPEYKKKLKTAYNEELLSEDESFES